MDKQQQRSPLRGQQMTMGVAALATVLGGGGLYESVFVAPKDIGALQEKVEQLEETSDTRWKIIGALKERVARLEAQAEVRHP